MRDLFEELVEQGEEGIERLVKERQQENIELDFKTKNDPARGNFEKSDKAVLGKALSAFSNSMGGIVIWGVDARPGIDDIDCAQSVSPISDIERFQSEAQTLVGQLLTPRHEGIRIEKIVSKRQPGAGYLLVSIQRSDRRPHRSEAAGDKQYYKRSGGSSVAMEHFDIEDASNRASPSSLELQWVLFS